MTTDNKRPPVWIGHVVLRTRRQKESEAFMRALGMRYITTAEEHGAVILELRGGTHLILLDDKNAESASDTATGEGGVLSGAESASDSAPAEAGDAPFDLMVDDIESAHRTCTSQGLSPTKIEKGRNHRTFFVIEPSGHRIKFFDSHVSESAV